jgi:hypothetical protein
MNLWGGDGKNERKQAHAWMVRNGACIKENNVRVFMDRGRIDSGLISGGRLGPNITYPPSIQIPKIHETGSECKVLF